MIEEPTNPSLTLEAHFPTIIQRVNLEPELDASMLKEIEYFETYLADPGNITPNPNGNQASKDFSILNSASNISKLFEKYVNHYAYTVLGEEPKQKITASWLNINRSKDQQMLHSHPNSRISGVFYIKTGENCGTINFTRPVIPGAVMLYDTVINSNHFTFDYIYFEPAIYELIIFPSWLPHYVTENKSDTDRISLAFNTFYNTSFGSLSTFVPLHPGK